MPTVHELETVSEKPDPDPMDPDAPSPEPQDNALSSLDAAIKTLNIAKEASSTSPAKTAFGSASVILTTIMVRFLPVYVDELRAKTCAGIDDR